MNINDIDFNKDYYGILGVSKDASQDDIKKAFRQASLKWHPDKHTDDSPEDKKNAEEKFKEANDAYSILSDASLREAYDNGPMSGGLIRRATPGEDVIARIHIKYKDICEGINNMSVRYRRKVKCKTCNGKGAKKVEPCKTCGGSGFIVSSSSSDMFSRMMSMQPCPRCYGAGVIKHDICNDCHGTGLKEEVASFMLTAPTENLINDGAMLFVGLGGSESIDGGPNGKLIFKIVHDLPDNINIAGANVIETVVLKYYDLILGTDVEITTPYGKKLKVKVPENCYPGTSLRAKGHGFNINGMKGDYIVVPLLDNKQVISSEEKKLLKQIRDLNKKK